MPPNHALQLAAIR